MQLLTVEISPVTGSDPEIPRQVVQEVLTAIHAAVGQGCIGGSNRVTFMPSEHVAIIDEYRFYWTSQ